MSAHVWRDMPGTKGSGHTAHCLCLLSLFAGFVRTAYTLTYDYDLLEPGWTWNADESRALCEQYNTNLPSPLNKAANDNLAKFLSDKALSAAYVDAKIELFPWIKDQDSAPVMTQGCYQYNDQLFTKVYDESRRSFTLPKCAQMCSGRAFYAVKGWEQRTWSADTIACMCGSSMSGLLQMSAARCPDKCQAEWCRVDNTNKPGLKVYSAQASHDYFTWTQDKSDLSNKHLCGRHISSQAIEKTDCSLKQSVLCAEIDGSFHKASSTMTWSHAVQYCQRRGAHLPDVTEYTKSGDTTFVWSSVTGRHLKKASGGGVVDYTNWSDNNPLVIASRTCVTMERDGYWREVSCEVKISGVVCQKAITAVTDESPLTSAPISQPITETTTSGIHVGVVTYSHGNVTDIPHSLQQGTTAAAAPGGGPGREHLPEKPGSMSSASLAGIIIGVVLGVVIVIALILLFFVICSRRRKEELPRTTRNSRVYRVSTEGNDYVSMSGRGSTAHPGGAGAPSEGHAADHASLPNGIAETELGPDDVFDREATYSLAVHPRFQSRENSDLSIMDNVAYSVTGSPARKTPGSDSSFGVYDVPRRLDSGLGMARVDEREADDTGVYSVPRLTRQATISPDTSGDYVEADTPDNPPQPAHAPASPRTSACEGGVPSPGGRIPSTASAASNISSGKENQSFLPYGNVSAPYDMPEVVDPQYVEHSPPSSLHCSSLSSPDIDANSPDHIYVNTLMSSSRA